MANKLNEIRQALADYMDSEGCQCCQNVEAHEAAAERLAELLNVDKYDDNSGYNFSMFRTSNS